MKASTITLAAMVFAVAGAQAQTKSAADGIAEYRALLADGNPAELFEANARAQGACHGADQVVKAGMRFDIHQSRHGD